MLEAVAAPQPPVVQYFPHDHQPRRMRPIAGQRVLRGGPAFGQRDQPAEQVFNVLDAEPGGRIGWPRAARAAARHLAQRRVVHLQRKCLGQVRARA